MAREVNIDLNIDKVGPRHAPVETVRLILARACGFTRDGGIPTLTEDCATIAALRDEAQRLKNEIDAALERARTHFDGQQAVRAGAQRRQAAANSGAAKPHIDTELKVRDVMSRDVRTVNRNDRLSVVDELMKLGGFRHVVVLDDTGHVVGVVSSRDIFYGALAWSLGLGRAAHEKSLASYPVKQVMSTDVATIAPDAELREAAELMMERRIGCVPVIDGGALVGILTDGDFLAILTGGRG